MAARSRLTHGVRLTNLWPQKPWLMKKPALIIYDFDGVMTEISMLDKSGKLKVVPVRCQTQKIDGFSGHSDFNQILGFVSRVRPKRVLVNHGEKSKSENVASTIHSRLKIRSSVPDNREIVRLR